MLEILCMVLFGMFTKSVFVNVVTLQAYIVKMASKNAAATLESNSKTNNFWLLATLLMKGGRGVLQMLFDNFIPPEQLTTILASKKTDLHKMNFFPDQLKILYPDKGRCAESKNFDITLLSRLLQIFWKLEDPSNGWKVLPNDDDTSVADDCVRINYYRNRIAHNTERELDDETFHDLWKKISDALIRIANHVSEEGGNHWEKAIEDFKKDSLSDTDKHLLKQTQDLWREHDEKLQKIKDILNGMHPIVQDTNKRVQDVQPKVEDILNVVKESAQRQEDFELKLKKIHEGMFLNNIF